MMALFKKLFGAREKRIVQEGQISEIEELVDPRTMAQPRRGGLDVRRSISEMHAAGPAPRWSPAEEEHQTRASSGAGHINVRGSTSEPGRVAKKVERATHWDTAGAAAPKAPDGMTPTERPTTEKETAPRPPAGPRAAGGHGGSAETPGILFRADLGAMTEVPKRAGAPTAISSYRSMVVRSGIPVVVRVLLKYASSPTTTMDFNREIHLHKKAEDALFVQRRLGNFETEHSVYLILDEVVGCLSYSSLRSIIEGRFSLSAESFNVYNRASQGSKRVSLNPGGGHLTVRTSGAATHVADAGSGSPRGSNSGPSSPKKSGDARCVLGNSNASAGGPNLPQSSFERRFASGVLVPVLVALAELHMRGIIHRDVRPETVLVTRRGQVVVGGLGNAVERKVERPVSQVGRVDFMAPEMITKPTLTQLFHRVVDEGISEDELPCYDDKVDVWSAGVVLMYLLTGCNPFGPTLEELNNRDILYSQSIESRHQADVQGQWANRVIKLQLKVSSELASTTGVPAKMSDIWCTELSKVAARPGYVFGDILTVAAKKESRLANDSLQVRPPGMVSGESEHPAHLDLGPAAEPSHSVLSEMSPAFWDLMRQVFVFDPTKRISSKSLLEHPYVRDVVAALCKPDVRQRIADIQAAQSFDYQSFETLTPDSFGREKREGSAPRGVRRSSVENRYRQYTHAPL